MIPDLPLLGYVATMSVTPGPNNLMLAASGVNFGFRRTLPHLLGVNVGHGIQIGVIAGSLAGAMRWLDDLRAGLVFLGCVYLLWLAWRQAQAGSPAAGRVGQPLGFVAAALFQWVNPKAWLMAFNAAILFLPPDAGIAAALSLALVCGLVNLPCIAVWALAGDGLRERLRDPSARRLFNGTMAALLAATALWIGADELRLLGLVGSAR